MDKRSQDPRKITRCRICGNSVLIPILDLGEQVLTGRFMRPEQSDPCRGPLRVVLCGLNGGSTCGLLQLSHSYDLAEMYGETYGYRSSLSQTMVNHLAGVVLRAKAWVKLCANDNVLDIGCNDGTLLASYASDEVARFGVDPSCGKFLDEYPEDIKVLVDFFSSVGVRGAFGDKAYKIITSIAMFYDLDAPMEFMKEIRSILVPDGIWVFEQGHMATMLDNLAFDSVCHEHLCYYNFKQIYWMAERCGLKILDVEVNKMNGASFCVTACRQEADLVPNQENINRLIAAEEEAGFSTMVPYENFAEKIVQFRTHLYGWLQRAKRNGKKVLGLGASTKGNVILQYCGVTPDLMPAIAEKYDWKVGLETPGSRIPIISEEAARSLNPDYFLVLPWHFHDEIIEREENYIQQGGKLVFALPKFEVISAGGIKRDDQQIPWAEPLFFGDEEKLVREALYSTHISDGPFVSRFEEEFSGYHGEGFRAITVSNGTAALELALRGLGIGPGHEVIVPGWGFAAAANTTLMVGATIVGADICPDTWLIDTEQVKRKISKKTKAVIVIHSYGNVCDMKALGKVCREAEVVLIEDCAESLFSRFDKRLCGTLADIATFSFQATKTITCGEGGAILVKNQDLEERMRLIRNHGMDGKAKYLHRVVGHNFRITNVQAAMLCAQFSHREIICTMRAKQYALYRQRLVGVPGLQLQEIPSMVEPAMWATAVYLCSKPGTAIRDAIIARMSEFGIECRPGFYSLSDQPLYGLTDFPVSDDIGRNVVVLPTVPNLAEGEINRICDAFQESLKLLEE